MCVEYEKDKFTTGAILGEAYRSSITIMENVVPDKNN